MAGVFDKINGAALTVWELLKGPAKSFCRLITSAGAHTLAADDGSLVSAFEIFGLEAIPPDGRADQTAEALAEKLSPLFDHQGRHLKFIFDYDPEGSRSELDGLFAGARAAAANSGLALEGVIGGQIKALSEVTGSERTLLVLWSGAELLSSLEGKSGFRVRVTKSSLDEPALIPDGLKTLHEGALSVVREALCASGLMGELLGAHALARAIKRFVYGEAVDRAWEPLFPQDEGGFLCAPPEGALAPPTPLRDQILSEDCVCLGRDLIRCGSVIHAPFFISVMPKERRPFAELFRALSSPGARLPLRAAFSLSSMGKGALRWKTALARTLSLAASENRQIVRAAEEIYAVLERGGRAALFSGSLSTSLSVSGFPTEAAACSELRSRKERIMKLISGWGQAGCQSASGDPLLGLAAAAPALMPHGGPAPRAAAPLAEALRLLPLRPASAWREGSLALRTPDGKIMPYAPNSSVQAAWIEAIVAPMGAGKSVLLNSLNLAFCLQPGLTRLPLLSVIDIGPSSRGLVDLLRAALPEGRRHEAAFHRLRLADDSCVNPFDTPLGLRRPLPRQMGFLVNLLSLFCSPNGDGGPPPGAQGIIRLAIEGAYREREARGAAFTRDVSPELFDLALESGMSLDGDTTVWEGVDFFFREGMAHEACLLQRMAVPVLEDCAAEVRQNPSVKAAYGFSVAESGEGIRDYVWRCLAEAVRDYPILAKPTSFSLGDARVMAIDLDEAAAKGAGAQGARQTAVMYMLARHLCASRFFVMPEDVSLMPELYRAWHAREIASARLDPKRLCYDELHRVTSQKALFDQLTGDLITSARESRKWNLSIAHASQSLADFPEVMLELATSVFICGAGTDSGRKRLAEAFGLDGGLTRALERIGKPTAGGAAMAAVFKTKEGPLKRHLVHTLSPLLLWAFSSQAEDTVLRNALYERFEPSEVLRVLSERHPGGIKREVERRRALIKEGAAPSADGRGVVGDILRELAAELQKAPGAQTGRRGMFGNF